MTDIFNHAALREPDLVRENDASTRQARFSALVQRQSRFVFRVAYAILRNSQDADDVVQETFLKLYRFQRWEAIESERAFLARTAWRIAVDRLPRRSNQQLDGNLRSEAADPERAAIAADLNGAVHRLVDSLPEELRVPLALSTVEDLKSPEIAAIMGIPEGTVRSRLNRARQILKQKLSSILEGSYGS